MAANPSHQLQETIDDGRRAAAQPAAAVQLRQTAGPSADAAKAEPGNLGAIANGSPRAAQLNALAQLVRRSPQALQQRALAQEVDNSPRMAAQRKTTGALAGAAIRRQTAKAAPAAQKPNRTGLPDRLKSGVESLSGMRMDHVKVHYNSPQPAQLNAHAYAQGSDIHVAPGQEKHVPHEAWHVVQQAQGRVAPTMQMKGGVAVNDDKGLEHEADVMGAKAHQMAGGDNARHEYFSVHDTEQHASAAEQGSRVIQQMPFVNIGAPPRINVGLSGEQKASRGNNDVVQRLVFFDPKSKTIVNITVRRPTSGLQSKTRKETNYHTAAIIIAQDMIATNLLGLTYDEALEFFENITNDIVTLPGFWSASEKVQFMILNLIDNIHALISFEAYEATPENWGAYLERLSEMYLQTLDQLDYTYHKKGSGEVGSSGEGTYSDNLREHSLGKQLDEKTLLTSALKLLDIRKFKPKSVKEAAPIIVQYLQKLMVAYPIFATNEYLRTALITIISRELGFKEEGALFQAVDSKLNIPDIGGLISEHESSDVEEIDPPSNWNGRSIPEAAFNAFISRHVRKFNIGGLRLTIISYSETNLRYRIGPRGG